MDVDDVTGIVIGSAIAVHRELGPGLLESAYQACMVWELARAGLPFERQAALPVVYRGVSIDCGYRLDLLIDGKVIVELKSVKQLEAIHTAQMLTYLKLSGCKVGLLVNFNVRVLRDGIKRLALGFDDRRSRPSEPPGHPRVHP